LIDIAPTVLEMFGVTLAKYMDGEPLAVANVKAGQMGNWEAGVKRVVRKNEP